MNTRMNRLLSEIKTEVASDGFRDEPDTPQNENFEGLSEAELAEQPKDPKARALFRMDAAARRAGLDGMLKALDKRVKATKDPGKLQGIVSAMEEIIARLEKVKKAAA